MPLAAFALPGATADNFDWARRKINIVRRLQRSSYAVGLQLKSQGKTLADLGKPNIRLVMPNPAFEGIVRQIEASLTKAGGSALNADSSAADKSTP